MKCYDCAAEIPAGAEHCKACGCPVDREKAMVCLRARLAAVQIESDAAFRQLRKARIALFVAAALCLFNGVYLLMNTDWTGGGAILMLFLVVCFVAVSWFMPKAPLTLSIVGVVLSLLILGGALSVFILLFTLVGLYFAISYTRAIRRETTLRCKLQQIESK